MQIVQELCRRPSLNQICFDMPTIYIENSSQGRPRRCVNQIQTVKSEKEMMQLINEIIMKCPIQLMPSILIILKALWNTRCVLDPLR